MSDRRPSQYELHVDALVALGRELGTSRQTTLAAEFYAMRNTAPNPAALEIAELILIGEDEG